MNTNEFAIGTERNVVVFDIRQLKPLYEFHNAWRTIGGSVSVSWSTNGRYIFTSDYVRDEFFFWDVRNSQKIPMSMEITNTDEWSYASRPGRRSIGSDEWTWIDDNFVTSLEDGVYTTGGDQRKYKLYSIHLSYVIYNTLLCKNKRNEGILSLNTAPHARSLEPISESANCSVRTAEYNEQTLQLAALLDSEICIWSQYKLPPYKRSQYQV